MDNRDWEIIITLHEKLNITKTAESLYLSQPSLTYRLNKLENEFGIKIVERFSTGVLFTKEGKRLLEYCINMKNGYDDIIGTFKSHNLEKTSTIIVGISTVYAKFYLADILNSFKRDFPNTKIELITGPSSKLPELFKGNKVDMLIVRGENDWKEEKYIIHKDPYGIVAAKGFLLTELVEKPWIQHRTENARIQSENIFLEWWNERYTKQFKTDIITVNSTEAALSMAEKGVGWTVLPKAHISQNTLLEFFPLEKKDGTKFLRDTSILYKKNSSKNGIIKNLVDYIINKQKINT
ncbi:LysR family transcriptional regulator [Fusobacterium sp. PH5-44]|uniref:LysR family transcriptional regulator n=1 Tax=unclassified Fusobacterium TaxID=2648384 RepID=UPI003D201471